MLRSNETLELHLLDIQALPKLTYTGRKILYTINKTYNNIKFFTKLRKRNVATPRYVSDSVPELLFPKFSKIRGFLINPVLFSGYSFAI